MQGRAEEVRRCYDLCARAYAREFLRELDAKPLDRWMLDRFADLVPGRGTVLDFGCGSGHTTAYLAARGGFRTVGLDFAPRMVETARGIFPELEFRVDDMTQSSFPQASADGIAAFYAIVHMDGEEVGRVFDEWRRLLGQGSPCLFSFHAGSDSLEVEDFLGVPGARATWRFHDPEALVEACVKAGFGILEAVVRRPYEGVEYPSRRAYILMTAR